MLLMCKVEKDICEDSLNKLYSLSDKDRREKADKLNTGHKKAVSLTAGLLKNLLQEKYGFKYVSISHSGEYAGALGENVPCGLDIEKLSTRNKKLVEKVCTKEELRQIAFSASPSVEFIKIWTVKEASFKAGIGKSLPEFFKENEDIEKEKKNFSYETEIIDNYAVTACIKKGPII